MPEERKLVSVLFADVVGSTAMGSENDPEVVRTVMARYFERMKEIAETHGGTVEKFIGDAVMVVFGVPRLHDDDAERAVRAAIAMRDAMPELNRELAVQLSARVGVNSGEAVTAAAAEAGQFLVTGDVVNVAARLQQSAEPGEVVVGALTEKLTRGAIGYLSREAVRAKGKAEPIAAFAALRARSVVPGQVRGLPALRAQLVGRQRELRLLLDTFARVREERRAHLFTVVGMAGVGKSRLVGEALARATAADGVRVLRGRCLPYGTGITYWPFTEMLREDAGIAGADGRDEALRKLERHVDSLPLGAPERKAIRARLGVILGVEQPSQALPDVAAGRVAAELAWGMRRHVETLASRRPTIVVIDDLQWGERALVEAVEQIAERVTDVPLLVLCVARRELLETHPAWGSGKPNATLITLDPLTPDETTTLIRRLLDIDELPDLLRARIVHRSEGNPLFVEEFLRMLIDEGRVVREVDRWRATGVADVRVPENVRAVIGARLDGLPAPERRALQVASVVGERFEPRQVAALGGDERADEALEALMRKGLVAEARGYEPELRFKHLLIRDVAYSGLPKTERASLHERFGLELEREVGDRAPEFAEILAHHAERAFTLSSEVRVGGELLATRALRALDRALVLAQRAAGRAEIGTLEAAIRTAAASSAALDDGGGAERRALLAQAEAELLINQGRFADARAATSRSAELAIQAGRLDLAAAAHLAATRIEVRSGEVASLLREVREAARLFEAIGDRGGVVETRLLELEVHWGSGDLSPMLDKGRRLVEEARSLGDLARLARVLVRMAPVAAFLGYTADAKSYLDEAERIADKLGLSGTTRFAVNLRGRLRHTAMQFKEAEAHYRRALAMAESAGDTYRIVANLRNLGEVLFDQRRYDEADAQLQRGLTLSFETGERWNRTEMLAWRAAIGVAGGEYGTAERFLGEARESLREGDVTAGIEVDLAVAALRSAEGRDDAAEDVLRRALAASRRTEFSDYRSKAAAAYGAFLLERGRVAEARPIVDEADRMCTTLNVGQHCGRVAALRRQLLAATG